MLTQAARASLFSCPTGAYGFLAYFTLIFLYQLFVWKPITEQILKKKKKTSMTILQLFHKVCMANQI